MTQRPLDVASLLAPGIAAISPYEPGKPIEELERELGSALPPGGIIKLASNENPVGPSPKAIAAAREALGQAHRYPDGGMFTLRRRLAAHHGISEGEILVGNGSNELIDLIVRTFCTDGEAVLAPAHSFLCYRLAAQAHGSVYREVPRGPDFAYDLDALAAAVTPSTKVIFLANPDNPTGVYAPVDQLRRMLRAVPPEVVVVLDEAYFEYATAPDYVDGLRLREERELLVVLRTFSKIYGLAGLRCGYGVAPRVVVDFVNRVRNPFNVSTLAQVGATAALDDVEHVEHARRENREGMALVLAGLDRLGVRYVPSQTNFVLMDVAPRGGRAVFEALLRRGVIVRPMGGYGLPSHLRVTIGLGDENRRFLGALSEVLGSTS